VLGALPLACPIDGGGCGMRLWQQRLADALRGMRGEEYNSRGRVGVGKGNVLLSVSTWSGVQCGMGQPAWGRWQLRTMRGVAGGAKGG
jgi:hypothetical protein